MSDVEVISIEGYRLILRPSQRATAEGEPWSLFAELDNGHGRASTAVWDLGTDLADFLGGLARDWRGWDGERSYSSLEGELDITARHDGLGRIQLVVGIGGLSPPAWRFETEMMLGAGAHAETIANDVAALFSKLREHP